MLFVDAHEFGDNLFDIDTILPKLNSHSNCHDFDVPVSVAICSAKSDEVSPTREVSVSNFLMVNVYGSRKVLGCSEVVRA